MAACREELTNADNIFSAVSAKLEVPADFLRLLRFLRAVAYSAGQIALVDLHCDTVSGSRGVKSLENALRQVCRNKHNAIEQREESKEPTGIAIGGHCA